MSNDKQTSIEYTVDKLENLIPPGNQMIIRIIIEQAKAMHKEEIENAFVECWKANMPDGYECKLSAKEYYNETFGGNNE